MGLIERMFSLVFGNRGNVLQESVEIFRENAEAAASRAAGLHKAALSQFAGEFAQTRRSPFDRIMDGVNRLPRPAMALGILGLFVSAMVDPVWFAARMQGIALVPEPLWWLLGAIVSFYFGARHQVKGQEFQRQIATTLTATPLVVENLKNLEALDRGAQSPAMASTGHDADLSTTTLEPDNNPALDAWMRSADRGR